MTAALSGAHAFGVLGVHTCAAGEKSSFFPQRVTGNTAEGSMKVAGLLQATPSECLGRRREPPGIPSPSSMDAFVSSCHPGLEQRMTSPLSGENGTTVKRGAPRSEEERLRVREKYRERLKERKLQIYQRALEEVILREKMGAQSKMTFSIHLPTRYGENVFLVGSESFLGSWNVDRAVPMTWGDGNVWSCVLFAPREATRIEYKYLIKEGERVSWEPGRNHAIDVGKSRGRVSALTISDSWGGGEA